MIVVAWSSKKKKLALHLQFVSPTDSIRSCFFFFLKGICLLGRSSLALTVLIISYCPNAFSLLNSPLTVIKSLPTLKSLESCCLLFFFFSERLGKRGRQIQREGVRGVCFPRWGFPSCHCSNKNLTLKLAAHFCVGCRQCTLGSFCHYPVCKVRILLYCTDCSCR